jgi:AraC-like DNA-binding protein
MGAPTSGLVFLHDPTVRLTYVSHRHRHLELLLVADGRGRFQVQGRDLRLGRNDALWLFPGQEHALLDHDRLRMWVAQFPPKLVAAQAASLGDPLLAGADPPGDWQRHLQPETAATLASLCARLAARDLPGSAQEQGLAWLLASAWIDSRQGIGKGRPLSPAVEAAVRLLAAADAPGSLPELARRCGCSPAWLSRRFHAETGSTIGGFTDRQRLSRFLERWQAGGTTITEAALAAGFGSYARFYAVYRRHAGGSPRELLGRPTAHR